MAGKYTYEDFRKAATDSGLLEQFSDADLKLAQMNPDAGMSILSYKQDYNAATTDEARALANYGANQIRSSYGEYTGGKTGGQFYNEPMTPGSFSYEEAPSFNYDLESDEVWQNYKKQYTREGKRATEDVLGQAAAMTGGIPSTAAITAAGQAGDYYNAQMTDKVADLYESAYNRYLGELNQYNTDKAFAYGQHLDEINDQTQKRQEALEEAILGSEFGDYRGLNDMGINTDQAQKDRELQLAQIAAQFGDYSYLEKLGIQIPKTGGNPKPDGDPDTEETADAALDRADANGGVVNSYSDWKLLVDTYGEQELLDSGYKRGWANIGSQVAAVNAEEEAAKKANKK